MLHAGFLLLCLRFLVAATGAVYPDVWPVLVLTAGGLGLSAWRPAAALFAFTVSVPLLNGLGYVGLAGLPTPVSVVFSGVFVGWIIRRLSGKGVAQGADPEVTGQGQRAGGGATDSQSCRATEAGEQSGRSDRWTVVTVKRYPTVQLAADVLITAVLASLIVQIVRHQDSPELWKVFWNQSGFGFGDPLYFITSAFVWLQGLFFFRMLCGEGTAEKFQVSSSKYQDRSAQGGGAIAAWAKPVFMVYGGTLLAFYLFQLCFHIPEPSDTITYCSPFEDIHSFGSIAVAVFAFALVSWVRRSWAKTALNGMYVTGLLALVVASWSRATWLAGALVLLLVAWIRLPKRWTAILVAMGAIAVVVLNANANRESWNQNIYLHRLITLVRFENPLSKDPTRVDLYKKAFGMIQEHPLTGHGIGSFYLTSVRFARPGDPYADRPEFAHNFLLQMAAELGVPAAALFAALLGAALWRGYRAARSLTEVPGSIPLRRGFGGQESQVSRIQPPTTAAPQIGSSVPSAESPEKADTILTPDSCLLSPQHEMLAVTMALTAYLLTQMTANSLNVYVSNQFFFWFLMAAVLCANPKSEVESLKSKVEV